MDNFKDVFFMKCMMLESNESKLAFSLYGIAHMNVIQYEHIHNDDDSFIEMLKIWLTGNRARTWRKLADALIIKQWASLIWLIISWKIL